MMISTCKINIFDLAIELSTRPVGAKARDRLLELLMDYEQIEIDFHQKALTPSFADECIGRLAATIGLGNFKKRIKLSNIEENTKPLVKHVVLKRCNETIQKDSSQKSQLAYH